MVVLKELEIQKNLIEMNLALAEKLIRDGGSPELVKYRMQDARKILEELFEDIKKAN